MKQIVITGATRGIGRAVAARFAREGWNLAVCSRNAEDLQELKGWLLGLHPGISVMAEAMDISSRAEVIEFAQKIHRTMGDTDVLVNNAGVFSPGTILQEQEGVLEQTMAVNLFGAYHLTRALVPGMCSRKSGHIFNLCSTASLKAYPNGGSYSISKFALLGFSKNLREELREFGIRVTALFPGPVFTDSWKGSPFPDTRFMAAADIADIIWAAWLLPPSAVVEEILIRPMLGDLA